MTRLLLHLYPRRWRRRYRAEIESVLEDLGGQRSRAAIARDLIRGALDARLSSAAAAGPIRRVVPLVLLVWLGISAEIVRSNVLWPGGDDDTVPVMLSYAFAFVVLAFSGHRAAAVTRDPRMIAAAGATAGALIGVLCLVTFVVVDNVFIGTVGQQQTKIDGLAASGLSSMRAYLNLTLLYAFLLLPAMLAVIGAGLATATGQFVMATRRRPA